MTTRHEWDDVYSPPPKPKRPKRPRRVRREREPKQIEVEVSLVPDDTPPAPRLPSRWRQIDDRISNFVLRALLKLFKAAVLAVLLAILVAVVSVFTLAVFG